MNAAALPRPDCTIDQFLGGLVTLVQPRRGHRAGLDAALLQAVVPADASGIGVDLGSGVGTVAFALAARVPGIRAIGVEKEAALVECAQAARTLAVNAGFSGRVSVVQGDVNSPTGIREAGLADGSAAWVLANPPFDAPGRVRPSPDPARRSAHVASAETLDLWVRAAARLFVHRGQFALIQRAAALPELLAALAGRFGDTRIRPVHPFAEAPAHRVLLVATKGSRGSVTLLPSFVLHEADGRWTPRADAVLRGSQHIEM